MCRQTISNKFYAGVKWHAASSFLNHGMHGVHGKINIGNLDVRITQ
jgi:hypothetical protein